MYNVLVHVVGGAFLGFLLHVTQVFVSRCCLSCSDGSVAVTGHPLCCTFLSWRTVFVAPPTGLCHVAPTFVHDSLHVTKSRLGGPYLTIACVQLIRGTESLRGKSIFNSKWEKTSHGPTSSGWSHLHFSSNMGLGAVSQVLNPKWQLAGSGPSLPGATQTFPLPVCRAFMAGSPGSLSPPCTTTLPPASQAGSSAQIPRRTFMEARWDSTALCLSLPKSALLFNLMLFERC